MRPISYYGIISMLRGIQSYSSFFMHENICVHDIIMLLGKVE